MIVILIKFEEGEKSLSLVLSSSGGNILDLDSFDLMLSACTFSLYMLVLF